MRRMGLGFVGSMESGLSLLATVSAMFHTFKSQESNGLSLIKVPESWVSVFFHQSWEYCKLPAFKSCWGTNNLITSSPTCAFSITCLMNMRATKCITTCKALRHMHRTSWEDRAEPCTALQYIPKP